MNRKRWWQPLVFVLVFSAAGLVFIGVRTYRDAPPIPTFTGPDGATVVSAEKILRGQMVFQRLALMEYGSYFGDGAGRGPDFTADALHTLAGAMHAHYRQQQPGADDAALWHRVQQELKANRHDAASNSVALSEGQLAALPALQRRYAHMLGKPNGANDATIRMAPAGYVAEAESVNDLTAFFFWGAWVCAAQRPGETYSYTHNWPYDPQAGNIPSSPVLLWSVFGALGLIAGLGAVLYLRGKLAKPQEWGAPGAALPEGMDALATAETMEAWRPTPGQRATYKYFAVAMLLFVLQIVAGVLTIHDFVGLTTVFGVDLTHALPITITRSWHLQLALLWISACWIGASLFVLPRITGQEPRGQRTLADILFWLLVVITAGSLSGAWMGPQGWLGEQWRLLGHQGWEFVELGRLWQGLLFAAFGLWAVIIGRGVWPVLSRTDPWNLPAWMLYVVVAILLLFISSFIAGPETNFVIADFWRWCVIHMWVEAFFELFTTVLVAYFLVLMGLVTRQAATTTVYLSALLFLGSGLLGISHNFYWNAKPVATMAIGSIFSTLQVVPLILLTLEAWPLRRAPQLALRKLPVANARFGQSEAFSFLLAVNFWNFLGAGVFGFIINLPIVNYYEHGTYLTVNHGHAALMGVYGNLSLAAVLWCARWMLPAARWNETLIRIAFWSLNIGLALMVVLDLFPVGVRQLQDVLDSGLWHARSLEFVASDEFQTFTWMRALGGPVFVVGGVLPLTWFVVSRAWSLKPGMESQAGGPT